MPSGNSATTAPKRSGWKQDWLRFILFGLINTGVTYGIYCLLVFVLPAQLSYLIVYVLGVLLAYIGNAKWVFQSEMRVRSAAFYPLIQLIQYLVTAAILEIMLRYFSMGPRVTLVLVIVIVTPLTFLMNRYLFRSRSSA